MFFVPIKLPHKVHYRLDLNFWLGIQIKVVYFEKAIKFCEISTLLLSTVHTDKSQVEILQNFVAFSMNFNRASFWIISNYFCLSMGLFASVCVFALNKNLSMYYTLPRNLSNSLNCAFADKTHNTKEQTTKYVNLWYFWSFWILGFIGFCSFLMIKRSRTSVIWLLCTMAKTELLYLKNVGA